MLFIFFSLDTLGVNGPLTPEQLVIETEHRELPPKDDVRWRLRTVAIGSLPHNVG